MRSAAAAAALGITLTLAGLSSCAGPQDPVQPPDPDPSSTPVFASDEEALAAAEELYGRYLDISNAIGAAGWVDTSELASVEKGDALKDDLDSLGKLASDHWKQVGKSVFDSLALEQLTDGGARKVVLTAYLCLDVSDVDVVNAEGISQISPTRPDRQALEVGFDDSDGDLKIDRSEVWTGRDFC